MNFQTRITSTPNVTNGTSLSAATNGYSSTNGINGHDSSPNSPNGINYDKLKQELVVEFRKELQSFKSDIITGTVFKSIHFLFI